MIMILSAAIVDKDGCVFVARQYTEMTKSKVEALYLAFSRLITKGKQHTFIETDEVRYVYQPINEFYCVLITTKQSNILEDIKTMSIFTNAINEYASAGKGTISEDSICENRYDLVFAFDEIVASGVRQINDGDKLRKVLEMKSEEEKAVVEALTRKEKEAKALAAEKSKQLDQQRKNEQLNAAGKSFGRPPISIVVKSETIIEPFIEQDAKPTKQRVISRGGLKLSARGKASQKK